MNKIGKLLVDKVNKGKIQIKSEIKEIVKLKHPFMIKKNLSVKWVWQERTSAQ